MGFRLRCGGLPSTRALIHAPWSASKVSTALRCPRLFHFKYVQKLAEPEVMPETRIGKAIHKALEQTLLGTPLPEVTTAVRENVCSRVSGLTGLTVAEVSISVTDLVTRLPGPARVH